MFRSLLLVTIPFISIAAHAVTFDYRHETNDKAGNNHKDRLLMSHRFAKEGANKRGNSSRLTQSFHFFMFEPIFSPVNALNQPI
ncbi:Oligogalacturonate-specific porin protein KdgM [Klebsiella grimontii]|nr:Oligogalacturonate-specific porin protein KdgM [Klebsiella grimontii]